MPEDLTELLRRANDGDAAAADSVLPLVYEQLRWIAKQRMDGERSEHTLQATALVHEAYMRLLGNREIEWANKAHFFGAAAEAMRRILIEHARSKNRIKRGGNPDGPAAKRIPLDVLDLAAADDPEQIVAVDGAIRRLEEEDPTAGSIVRLRFYAGLSVEQTAAALGISERTVMREWAYAKAVLFKDLEGGES